MRQPMSLMALHGIVDVLIPRGGAGLIRHCVEHSKVPIIKNEGTDATYTCTNQPIRAIAPRYRAECRKCRRYGVCNAAETLLVDRSIAHDFLPGLFTALANEDVLLHCDRSRTTVR